MSKIVDLKSGDRENLISEMVRVLNVGGVVLHPTETCYGLAASAVDQGAIEKIYKIKGRDFSKPLSICVADEEMALKYGNVGEKLLALARDYWPGPLSILVERRDLLPKFLNPGERRVSMRVPGDEVFREVIRRVDVPVVSTSANVAGEPELYCVDLDIFSHEARDLIDLVLDGGEIPHRKPSTIVGVDQSGHLEVLREGEIVFARNQK